ncbi:fimbrial protein [Providencia hangzhouensis]|uniref:fimbrial protein n=1 Tax=Providencia hangzhouensis TaxID=3031799 RepID=UPI0034DD244E
MKPLNKICCRVTLAFYVMFFSYSSTALVPGTHDFTFDLTVPKNTCDIAVTSDSGKKNIVDFGNVPLSKFGADASSGKIKKAFDVVISNCNTNSFDNNYIKLTGNYTINDGFLDNPGKTFAVRISANDNANQSSADFITETNNVLWSNIKTQNVTKTFYAYVMCKNQVADCSIDQNIGAFKATLTLSYYAD